MSAGVWTSRGRPRRPAGSEFSSDCSPASTGTPRSKLSVRPEQHDFNVDQVRFVNLILDELTANGGDGALTEAA